MEQCGSLLPLSPGREHRLALRLRPNRKISSTRRRLVGSGGAPHNLTDLPARVANAPASCSAAGSEGIEAPRRFGFCGPVAHEFGVSTVVGRRSKAPSPLRSAGALHTLRE